MTFLHNFHLFHMFYYLRSNALRPQQLIRLFIKNVCDAKTVPSVTFTWLQSTFSYTVIFSGFAQTVLRKYTVPYISLNFLYF